MINIFSSSRYQISKRQLAKQVSDIVEKMEIPQDQSVNIAFVGKRKMTQIAETYKNESVALPVLAFPYKNETPSSEDPVFGEIVICYPQAVLLAAERGRKVDVMLLQLIEHGLKNLLK